MTTPAMRRYAAEVYRLQQDLPQVGLSELSEAVGASLQATSRMVGRMKDQGFLEHELYRGVRLTGEGERIAMPALRRHRLVEVFLVSIMKYGWDEAHDLSDQFELGINDHLEDRLDDLTGHPTRCPHGEPIPSKDGVMAQLHDTSLANLHPVARCRISRVRTHNPDELRYFAELGLFPDTEFELRNRIASHGPFRIQFGKREHVLGHNLAAALYVEEIPGPSQAAD
jgi:DtxR family transcriptional regulator, Mn-dependent transcriptional regulator